MFWVTIVSIVLCTGLVGGIASYLKPKMDTTSYKIGVDAFLLGVWSSALVLYLSKALTEAAVLYGLGEIPPSTPITPSSILPALFMVSLCMSFMGLNARRLLK